MKTYMMGYNYNDGWGTMGGAGALGFITWIVVLVDLALLGVYLWKKIK